MEPQYVLVRVPNSEYTVSLGIADDMPYSGHGVVLRRYGVDVKPPHSRRGHCLDQVHQADLVDRRAQGFGAAVT